MGSINVTGRVFQAFLENHAQVFTVINKSVKVLKALLPKSLDSWRLDGAFPWSLLPSSLRGDLNPVNLLMKGKQLEQVVICVNLLMTPHIDDEYDQLMILPGQNRLLSRSNSVCCRFIDWLLTTAPACCPSCYKIMNTFPVPLYKLSSLNLP